MPSKHSTRQRMNDRLILALPADLKARLFDTAAARGVPASDLARRGIASVIGEAA